MQTRFDQNLLIYAMNPSDPSSLNRLQTFAQMYGYEDAAKLNDTIKSAGGLCQGLTRIWMSCGAISELNPPEEKSSQREYVFWFATYYQLFSTWDGRVLPEQDVSEIKKLISLIKIFYSNDNLDFPKLFEVVKSAGLLPYASKLEFQTEYALIASFVNFAQLADVLQKICFPNKYTEVFSLTHVVGFLMREDNCYELYDSNSVRGVEILNSPPKLAQRIFAQMSYEGVSDTSPKKLTFKIYSPSDHKLGNYPSISEILSAIMVGREINPVVFPQARNKTLLLCAVEDGNRAVVEFLLKNNADPNVRSLDDVTPLRVAVMNNNAKMAALLVEYKADINLKASDGYSALDFAIYYRYMDCVIALRKSLEEKSIPEPAVKVQKEHVIDIGDHKEHKQESASSLSSTASSSYWTRMYSSVASAFGVFSTPQAKHHEKTEIKDTKDDESKINKIV